jgi:site-specific recombinase XerD
LQTTYSAGLRVSEVLHLKVTDIDSQRMCLRIEQGKRRKDRYVPLSARLLPDLRTYWQTYRPWTWLFPNHTSTQPLSPVTAHRIFHTAKERAGIVKPGGIHSLRHSSPHYSTFVDGADLVLAPSLLRTNGGDCPLVTAPARRESRCQAP